MSADDTVGTSDATVGNSAVMVVFIGGLDDGRRAVEFRRGGIW